MADTNITPPKGSLTASGSAMRVITIGLVLMGFQPVVSTGIVGATGSITTTGYTSGLQQTSPTAALTLTGFPPSVQGLNTTLTPGKGTLVLGIVVNNSVSKSVPSGSLTLTAQLPTIINPAVQTPPAGTLALQGAAPVISNVPVSTTGTITTQGYAPRLDRGYVPGAASLKCTPVATIAWSANTESDLAGYKVYQGLVSHTYTTSVDVGNVLFYVWNDLPDGTNYFAVTAYDTTGNESVLSDEVSTVISGRGYAPTITVGTASGTQIDTGAGSLTLTGRSPIVDRGIIPSAGALVLTGQNGPPDTGVLTLSGKVPTIAMGGPLNFVIVPDVGSLTLAGYVRRQIAEPLYGMLTLQGYAGTVTVQVLGSASITPPTGALTFFSPTPFNPNFAKNANHMWSAGGTPDNA